MKQHQNLERLARERFEALSWAEVKLVRSAPKGEMAWCGPSEKDDDPANNPATADQWGAEREIRAAVIRWLAVDREAASRVDPFGIQVHGAKIVGPLDLSFVAVPFRLRLLRCRLTHDADLISAQLPALNLRGSWVRSISADGADVKGSVFLGDGFSAEGEVRLLGAQIGGTLSCIGGTFKNPGKDALSADRADVKGSVFLGDGFSAEGAVRLLGAQIGGNLDCRGGTFKNAGKDALNADQANVKGSVFLRKGFSAEGEVRLPGAQIGGNLECGRGTFKNPAQQGIQESGNALNADRVNVKGNVFLREGFSAQGAVRLPGAQIGGDLDCHGGTFKNPGNNALVADRANVRGNVFLGEGFSAEGEVRLPGAQIGGDLDCRHGRFAQVFARSATIKGGLIWDHVGNGRDSKLDLTNARAGALVDDDASWPAQGNLELDGFVYDRIGGSGPRDATTRLRWLERQAEFRPQPYRQLARVLREEGDEQGARKLLFEMEHRRRKKEDRGFARFWSWVLRWTIGYGFYSWRALLGLLFLTLVGWGLFYAGYHRGAIVPTDKEAYQEFRTGGRVPAHYQEFNSFVYSLENSVPVVDLAQTEHWTPDPHPQGSGVVPESGFFGRMANVIVQYVRPLAWVTSRDFLRGFRWAQVLLGWLLATLFVAAVTGVVRKE